jgi:hypothetical protein
MATDPHPFHCVANEMAYGAMMITYAHGETTAAAAFEFLEIERRVGVIRSPKLVAFSRSPLHVGRKHFVQLPETAGAF